MNVSFAPFESRRRSRQPRTCGIALTVLIACAGMVCGRPAWGQNNRGDPGQSGERVVKVATIAFSGPGLDGIPTTDYYNDQNGNDVVDPGEPVGITAITPPEYVAWTLKNKPGFELDGTRFHVAVQFTIEGVGNVQSASASATCSGSPELIVSSRTLTLIDAPSGTYEATFQIPATIDTDHLYHNYTWSWSIVVNGDTYSDSSTNTVVYNEGTGK